MHSSKIELFCRDGAWNQAPVPGLDRVPHDVLEAMERIRGAGHGVWVVGGALRDLLLGIEARDWDLATSASPEEVTGLFKRVIPLGLDHGTVVVHSRGRDLEVTSVPGKGEEGILADLERRDFTVNALALSCPGGRLLDPFSGRLDLARRTLRGVENPRARFQEDPLRVLRGLRFVSTLGFRIEPATFGAMKAEAHGLDRVAAERIREELFKLLLGRGVIRGLELAFRSGVLSRLLPELEGRAGRNRARRRMIRTAFAVCAAPCSRRTRVATLLRGIERKRLPSKAGGTSRDTRGPLVVEAPAPPLSRILERWRLSRKEIREIGILASTRLPLKGRGLTDETLRHIIVRVGPALVPDLVAIERAERMMPGEAPGGVDALRRIDARLHALLSRRFPLAVRDLALSGQEVMEFLGVPPGPEVGDVLHRLFLRVLRDPGLNDRKILMDFIKKNEL